MAVIAGRLPGRPLRIDYGPDIEAQVRSLVELIERSLIGGSLEPRWLAVKLLEGEGDLLERVGALEGGAEVVARARDGRARIESLYGDGADIAIADARYGFVHGVAQQVVDASRATPHTTTERLDRVLTHRVLGLPIFFAVMFLMFKLVVDVSAWYLDWVDGVIGGPLTRWSAGLLGVAGAPAWASSLVLDGIIAGLGAVLVFLPGLMVLFLFLTLLEDSGYMARVAYVMDRVMRVAGLHGKSFIPLILGFGCAVPAVMATRTLEDRRQRIATTLLVPLMSCSARLPVYVVFGMAFFGAASGALITGLYFLGIAVAAVVGLVLSRTLLRGAPDPVFALELPPYRLPHPRGLLAHTWQKVKEFVTKAGTVILAASLVLWLLMSLPFGVADRRDSVFGQLSAVVAPALAPAGFDSWESSGALVTGFLAKELVVSTMSQAYLGADAGTASAASPTGANPTPTVAEDLVGIGAGFLGATRGAVTTLLDIVPGMDLATEAFAPADTRLSAALATGFAPLAALAFVVFVLLYTPCVATLATIRTELGWRWMGLSALYQLALAWLIATIVFQLGRALGLG